MFCHTATSVTVAYNTVITCTRLKGTTQLGRKEKGNPLLCFRSRREKSKTRSVLNARLATR